MAVGALPVDHPMLHEENDPAVDCCEGQQGRISNILYQQGANRKKRNKQKYKGELEPQEWLLSIRLSGIDDDHFFLLRGIELVMDV